MLGGMMQSIGIGGTVEASEMNISWLTFDNANERLGIGTTTPSRKLEVQGGTNDYPAMFRSSDSNVYITFMDSDTNSNQSVRVGATGDNLKTISEGYFQVNTNSADRFRIKADGTFDFKSASYTTSASHAVDGYVEFDVAGTTYKFLVAT